jgi:hypothetical protein
MRGESNGAELPQRSRSLETAPAVAPHFQRLPKRDLCQREIAEDPVRRAVPIHLFGDLVAVV